MTDLSHWDFADQFSGREVASLILGIEPSSLHDPRLNPILTRLDRAYRAAIQTAFDYYSKADPVEADKPPFGPDVLRGYAVEMIYATWIRNYDLDETLSLIESLWENFEHDAFARDEVGSWLKSIGLVSKYDFAQVAKKSLTELAGGNSVASGTAAIREMGQRERSTLLKIIGGLQRLMLEPHSSRSTRSGYDNQAAIIEALTLYFPKESGLSQRNLEKYFAESKRVLEGDSTS